MKIHRYALSLKGSVPLQWAWPFFFVRVVMTDEDLIFLEQAFMGIKKKLQKKKVKKKTCKYLTLKKCIGKSVRIVLHEIFFFFCKMR